VIESLSTWRRDTTGTAIRTLSNRLAPTYFLDQTRSDQNARFYSNVLNAERSRHVLLEEEQTRLHRLRYEREVAELREWTTALQEAVDYHSRIAESRGAELDARNLEVQALRHHVEVVENRVRTLDVELNAIYRSRAWRLVGRARRIHRAIIKPPLPKEETPRQGPPLELEEFNPNAK
jgi:hypothetical protein